MLVGYAVLFFRITHYMQRRGFDASDAMLYAVSCIVGKFPSLLGIIQYWLNRIRGKQSRLIENKHASANDAREQA